MSRSATRSVSRVQRSGRWWLAVTSIAIAVVAPLPYLLSSLGDLAADDNNIAANYADRPGWLRVAFYVHVCFGGLAMLLAPLQLSARVRERVPRLHRVSGRISLVSIWIAAPAGLLLAPFSLAGTVGLFGFGGLAIAWFVTATGSYRTIRRGDVDAHRRWATRTFAMTYAAVTLRLWLGVLMGVQIGIGGVDPDLAFDRAYHLVPFLCWVPNLIVAEVMIGRAARESSGMLSRTSGAVRHHAEPGKCPAHRRSPHEVPAADRR